MSKSGIFSFSIRIFSLFLSGMKSKSRAEITLKTAFFQKWSRTRNRFNVTIRHVIFPDSSRRFPPGIYQDKRLVAIPNKAITNRSQLVRHLSGFTCGITCRVLVGSTCGVNLWGQLVGSNLSGTCPVQCSVNHKSGSLFHYPGQLFYRQPPAFSQLRKPLQWPRQISVHPGQNI